jgi:signal transduction histidine kinase
MTHHPHRRVDRARIRFFRRLAFVSVVVLALAVFGFITAILSIAGGAGSSGWTSTVIVLLMIPVGLVMVALVRKARGFAWPLGAVMEAADRVAEGDYSVHVHESGPPAIRALTRSFNTMTRRLQDADRVRRNLMADVAHELRTPLSVLQGRLEGLLDGVYARDDHQISQLLDETRVLSRLVEDLRTVALSEAGALPLEREPTDVVSLARGVADNMGPEAARSSVLLHVSSSINGTVADVDPLRIREVLTNLVANAIRYSPTGGLVTLTIAADAEAIVVTVADTGEGMTPETLARLFDRFHKGPGSRGSGLGLAIAKGIVAAHGGNITASSAPGRGTQLTFTLPAAGHLSAG